MKSIEIDLDVHRAIENARLSFDETENAILRRALGIDPRTSTSEVRPRPRLPRSSGAYSTSIDGAMIEANSLKELLRRALLVLEKRRPGFLASLANYSTPRGRRIVARSPEALYANSPHLAGLAEKVDSEWWFDTNVSRNQVEGYMKTLAQMAKLPVIPTVQKRSEKTTLTLEDLDLL